ncbi:MAG: hypothetical protein Q8Q09_17020 [Deltaproteobacteria bacterium]|nr:hypothetical protein [Deltaproteobacteria bacterium]
MKSAVGRVHRAAGRAQRANGICVRKSRVARREYSASRPLDSAQWALATFARSYAHGAYGGLMALDPLGPSPH